MDLPIKDAEIQKKLDSVKGFKIEEDLELLRGIDTYRVEKLADLSIKDMKEGQFSFSDLPLASNSPLREKELEVTQTRVNFLVRFNVAVATLLRSTHFEEKRQEDTLLEESDRQRSIQEMIFKNKEILLPRLKLRFMRSHFESLTAKDAKDLEVFFSYDRKLALQFKKLAKKHDPDFITNSTFGQYFQALRHKET